MSGILVRFRQRDKHFNQLLLNELTKGHSALGLLERRELWKPLHTRSGQASAPRRRFPRRCARAPLGGKLRQGEQVNPLPLPSPGGSADLAPVSSFPASRPSALPGCAAAGAGAGTAAGRSGGRAGRRAGLPTGSRWCRRRGSRRRRKRRPRLGASPGSGRLRPGARPLRPGLGGAGEAGGPSPGGGCAKAAPGSGPAPSSTCRAPHAAPERSRPRTV